MAGYSGKSLAQKLGIKLAMSVVTINEPPNYRKLVGGKVNFSKPDRRV